MFWKRSVYAFSAGDILGSLLVFLVFIAFFSIILFYIGYIGLLIFLSIGAVIGLSYSIFIYIRSFISALKGLGTVIAGNAIKTFLLKWFTLYYKASQLAFLDNFSIARSSLTKSHGYRMLSFRKWMWLMVAPTTLVFGTMLIFAVIIIQGGLLISIIGFILLLILLLCAVMLLVGLIYGIIATGLNLRLAPSWKTSIFKSFDFSLSADLNAFLSSIKLYFKTTFSYMGGILVENFALGKSNVGLAGKYRLFSIQSGFLYISIISLLFVATLFDFVLFLLLIVLFPVMAIVNLIWIFIAKIIRIF